MNTAYLFWHNEMTILKVCKPNNFKSHYFLKLTFPRIGALCSNFIGCDSYLGFNPPNFLALCGTNLEDSIGISNFTVTGSYAWSCSFGNLYKKLKRILFFVCHWLYFIQCLFFSRLNYIFFMHSSWSKIDEVLSMN